MGLASLDGNKPAKGMYLERETSVYLVVPMVINSFFLGQLLVKSAIILDV